MGRNMRIAAFPIIVGFLTGFGLYLMKIPDLVMPRLEFLLNAIISCATTVSGFIISSVAILIGATESQIMIKIKRNGGFPELKSNRQISRRIKRPPSQRISNEMAVSIFIMV